MLGLGFLDGAESETGKAKARKKEGKGPGLGHNTRIEDATYILCCTFL